MVSRNDEQGIVAKPAFSDFIHKTTEGMICVINAPGIVFIKLGTIDGWDLVVCRVISIIGKVIAQSHDLSKEGLPEVP